MSITAFIASIIIAFTAGAAGSWYVIAWGIGAALSGHPRGYTFRNYVSQRLWELDQLSNMKMCDWQRRGPQLDPIRASCRPAPRSQNGPMHD